MRHEALAVDDGPVTRGARSHHPLFAVGAVLLGTFLSAFDVRLFTVGLADLRGAFSLGFDDGAWLSTAATAPQIFIAPAAAWLVTVFGIRRVLAAPSVVYALVSVVIPFTHNFEILIFLHIARALLLGLFVPVTILIILRNLQLTWWIPAIAIYAFRAGFTQNAGVSLGGFYFQALGWQWMYWQDAFIAPLMMVFAFLGAPHERVNRKLLISADWGGMLLFGAGLCVLYVALDQANRLDWFQSTTIKSLAIAGLALFVLFAINESLVARPWAHGTVLKSRNIGLVFFVAIMFMFASVSNSALVTGFLMSAGQLRPEEIGGLLLLYGGLPMIALTVLAVSLIRYVDVRYVMIMGLVGYALACLYATQLTSSWRLDDFAPVVLLQSIGQTLTFPAIIIFSLANTNPAKVTAFSAYIQILRLGGPEVGNAISSTWIRMREQTYSNLLGQHVVSGSAVTDQTIAALTAKFQGIDFSTATQRALATTAAKIQAEANALAYVDAFWLCFAFSVAGLAAVIFMTRAPKGPFSPITTPSSALKFRLLKRYGLGEIIQTISPRFWFRKP